MTNGTTDEEPRRVPERASPQRSQPGAIDLVGTESLYEILGDRAKRALLLDREPTDWKAGCGKSACPVWREGERTSALPTPI